MDERGPMGRPVERREDPALVTGRATYTDDLDPAGLAHVAFVRSQYGHAEVTHVDTSEAEAHPDVVAVFTAADLEAAGVPNEIHSTARPGGGETTVRPFLADEVVRFVGEALAIVVATDRYAAHEAAGLVDVGYDRLDAVVDAREALAEDAPPIHDGIEGNRVFDWTFGDRAAVDRAMEAADHVVELEMHNQRLIPDPIEPRGTLASHDPATGTVTIDNSTQRPHRDRAFVADSLGLAEHRVRVRTPAVGGAFGTKGRKYPETALVAWTSMQLERPVKWIATRTEAHRTDLQSRDLHVVGRLAVSEAGDIEALSVAGHLGVGAYVGWGPTTAGNFQHLLSGQYDVPVIAGRVVGAITNTTPTGPYRGAGRPESIFTIERLVHRAAEAAGMDPVALRRRNLLPPDAFPHETATGAIYDSGDYEPALDRALELVDYEARRAAEPDDDRLRGVGVSCFVESTGSSPRSNPESASIETHRSGRITAYSGTADTGQGHATSYAQILAEELGLPMDDIDIVEGDTDDLLSGRGSFGSRSMAVGGSAMREAARKLIEEARPVAAHALEAAAADLVFEDGAFHVTGSPDRAIDLADVFALVYSEEPLPEGLDRGLEVTTFYDPASYAYSFGTHVAVVEVEPGTGGVEIVDYAAVDDCGTQVNPRLVEGQIHGGIAQGISQALLEEAVYDDAGSLATGSLQDYALPRAEHVPELTVDETVTPCPHNPLGAKGAGESGTIGAPPAVVNAVVDALDGVDHVDTPLTPERVWRATNG